MIPIELTIQGLYSYQKRQTINFRELTSAGLFGIFGGVGSGKSSILEAITFAIYGKTDRLNLSGDNRNYNMMNLKSDELLIDFTFETGKDQTAYRSIVKGRRNRKRFEEVRTLDRTAYKKINNEWIPVEINTLEEAIGLSYNNFKRTIIIPQGQFQEFLQLGNKDRTQMMKELFNLGKYEFYYKVVSVESRNNSQKQNIEGQLQQLGTPDPEQLKMFQEQLIIMENEIKEQDLKLRKFQNEEEKLRNLQTLVLKKNDAEKYHNTLVLEEPYFIELEKKIARYEQCVISFKHLLNNLNELRIKEKDRKELIEKDSKLNQLETDKINLLETKLNQLKPLYEKREELIRKSVELTTLLRIKKLEKSVEEESNSVSIGTKFWNDTLKEVESLKVKKADQEKNIKDLQNKKPDLTLLYTINTWYNDKQNLVDQLYETEKNIERCTNNELAINKEKNNLITSTKYQHILKNYILDSQHNISVDDHNFSKPHEKNNQDPTSQNYNELYNIIELQTTKLKQQKLEIDNREKHILVKDQLKNYARDLQDNTPCPLCGSLHHPEIYSSDDVTEELTKIKENRQVIVQTLEDIFALTKNLNMLETRHGENSKHITEQNDIKKLIKNRINEHNTKFTWEKFKNREKLNKAFEEDEEIHKVIDEKEKNLQSLLEELAKLESKKERAREKLDNLRYSLTINQTELKTLRSQIQIIKLEDYKESPDDEIEAEKTNLLNKYTQIEQEYLQNYEQIQEVKKANNILKGRLETNKSELETEVRSIQTLEIKLKEELKNSNCSSLEEVEQILSEQFDSEKEKKRISSYKNKLLQSKSSLDQYINEIGNREYSSTSHQMLIEQITSLQNQIRIKNQEHGKISEIIKYMQQNIETQAVLTKKLENLEERAENIKTLKSLFKASGFVNYISSVYLQNLCNAANDRFFQLTRQKLRLEITGDNNFQVRDFMNGGKVRSVKTLSGGQTFQASLSLALALADNIQKITQSNQNFFFLDEGFGSLDKESLDIVFDTLKTLRKENRIVGVISHVEEMQQEIDVHLRIFNDDENGSIIRSSAQL